MDLGVWLIKNIYLEVLRKSERPMPCQEFFFVFVLELNTGIYW